MGVVIVGLVKLGVCRYLQDQIQYGLMIFFHVTI